eukprot:CAMPEP_0197006306 /NCGR_PEP_ID=MMETSP1380-20130617/34183_1 /TAXON_ID=5936 /ORGANISM="Euplotes crassus, Strain CT5" /LENGTH=270 /DNA_ID=CAMNT_0042425839 /DNA_START=132 /DNA_END=945 /DNA_ORIENTATION=+
MKRSGASEEFKKQVNNEVAIMKELNHENIIKLLDFSDDAQYTLPDGRSMDVYYIALELAEHGEIFDIVAETGRFSEPTALFYFHQLVESLENVHKTGISHRDIKLENILLDSNLDIKLTDFGFAEFMEVSGSRKGTSGYIAPEMHYQNKFMTQPLDIFALGIVLFILIKGSPPFMHAKGTDPHYRLFVTNPEAFWKAHFKRIKDYFPSNELIELLTTMLSPEPESRITLAEIKESAWYTNSNHALPTKEDVIEDMAQRLSQIESNRSIEH